MESDQESQQRQVVQVQPLVLPANSLLNMTMKKRFLQPDFIASFHLSTIQPDADAWGVAGDIMMDEDGNPDIDEGEVLNADDDGGEEGWDVSFPTA
jgi:hypothetical protein